jgi:hypothetical protein
MVAVKIGLTNNIKQYIMPTSNHFDVLLKPLAGAHNEFNANL